MKIRIKDNSIRLRLTKTDVDDLRSKKIIHSETVISSSELFKYSLDVSSEIKNISARFKNGKITVSITAEMAHILTETNEITVKGEQENGADEKLFLLIEKDMQCLDESAEDQSDMYENPNSSC